MLDTLMNAGLRTEESSDPVAEPAAQHGVSVLARRDEEIRAILEAVGVSTTRDPRRSTLLNAQVRELEMGHRPEQRRGWTLTLGVAAAEPVPLELEGGVGLTPEWKPFEYATMMQAKVREESLGKVLCRKTELMRDESLVLVGVLRNDGEGGSTSGGLQISTNGISRG
jgi:hypothetical protein